ncbi:LacI family DNA-binding transcriptional regulator [Nesterenkonia sp. NBAIMH1]|uniref:LacI family DNA-binding transcriptional regulator n=1 Tax=Nesterenkonia sp. NBAIMH1 TaxID=2600320 RepID=UPI0011B42A07|nr:LacI family DNA-binding transcriptional regulator [Nesterenkonia sp. NBAIMH1]
MPSTHTQSAGQASRQPTLEDVARQAGVSRATASRVVNQDPRVGLPARESVEAAILSLGYRPNRAARSLVRREADSIAVVVPEAEDRIFTDPFFSAILGAVYTKLADSPVQVLLAVAPPGKREKIERYLRGGYTDGAIIVSHHLDDGISEVLRETRLPSVYIGRPYAGDVGLPYVDVDNVRGAEMAVRRLVDGGRRRIATIAGPQDMAAASDRLEGFRRAMAEAGLEDDLVEVGDFTAASGGECAVRLLERDPGLDAIFVASDLMAVPALQELQIRGVSVPEQVAVIGYDDSEVARLARPPLTTVEGRAAGLAHNAVEMLSDLMAGKTAESRLLSTNLVLRESG